MKSPLIERLNPFTFLIVVIIVTLISFLLFTFIGFLLVVGLYGVGIQDILQQINPDTTTNVGILKLLQIFQSIGIFIVPALIVGWLASKNAFSFLGFKKQLSGYGLALMLIVLLAAEPIVALSGIINEKLILPEFLGGIENWMSNMEDQAMVLTEAFLKVTTISGLSVNILMIAIIPAIGEELFFRGLLQPLFKRWFKNTFAAIVVTSILFSALHMQFYGFLPRFLLGVLFGYIFVWTKNIWYPIIAHFIHNLIPVVGYYLYASEKSTTSFEEIGSGSNTWIWALGGLILLIIFVKLLIEKFQENNNQITDYHEENI